MNVPDIISKALIEYDSVKPIIRYLMKNTIPEIKFPTNAIERTKITFVTNSEPKKIILETEVELLAVYYDKYQLWAWAWSLSGLNNSTIYLSKKLLIYALDLGADLTYIKSILTTSRGVIKDNIQVDVNLALGSAFIKQPYIYPFITPLETHNLIYYFILLDQVALQKIKIN